MSYQSFDELFPDIAARETRAVTILPDTGHDIPPGHYVFTEMYCNEPGCDCRRVMFMVLSSPVGRVEAVIAWGWEKPGFYRKWLGMNNPALIRDLKGPVLNDGSPQEEYAHGLLELVRNMFFTDAEYVKRIKRHYRMFREKVDPAYARKAKMFRRKPR